MQNGYVPINSHWRLAGQLLLASQLGYQYAARFFGAQNGTDQEHLLQWF